MAAQPRKGAIDLGGVISSTLGAPPPHPPAESHEPAGPPAVIAAAIVPAPHSPAGEGDLSAGELADLAVCEAALDNLRLAFAAAGKALQVVRDGRLYRSGYGSFEDYAEQRWDISRAQAYRLIAAWPLAERLSPIGDRLTESQIRELLPVSDQHGPDAAAVVYETIATADGIRVTAALVKGAVSVLPRGYFDQAEAVRQIREYLNRQDAPPARPARVPADPVQKFNSAAGKLLASLEDIRSGDVISAARSADPTLVRKTIATVRAMLDEIEQEVTTPA